MDDVEIVGLCDINRELCDKTASQFGIAKVYANDVIDYRRMVSELKPDAVVSIGNPHELYDSWRWFLEQGVPLCIEKPLGMTLHQTRALVYLAEKADVATQVLFQRRYTPVARKALSLCKERGDIVHAVCKFYKCDRNPMLIARDHILDDTVHAIDTLRWICGGEAVNVDSHCRRVGTPDVNFVSAVIYFDNGAVGHLINSWTSGKRIFAVEMHSEGVFAEIEHEKGGYVYSDGALEGLRLEAVAEAGSDKYEVYTGVAAAMRDFIDAVKTGGRSESDFSDAAKTMEIAYQIQAADVFEAT
jgi:predicted dehydrogenase